MTGLWIVTATAVMLMSSEELALEPPKADHPVPRQESSLEITILPGAWIPRLDGESSFGPAGAGDIHLSRQLALNSSEPTVNLELTIRNREVWEVHFIAFDFSTDSANGPSSGKGFCVVDAPCPHAEKLTISMAIAAEAARLRFVLRMGMWAPLLQHSHEGTASFFRHLDAIG